MVLINKVSFASAAIYFVGRSVFLVFFLSSFMTVSLVSFIILTMKNLDKTDKLGSLQ